MAARGSIAKQNITNQILTYFPGAFAYEKEIRIPYVEDGIEGQIKVTLTAAKVMVENEGNSSPIGISPSAGNTAPAPDEKIPDEPSAEEKERLAMLINRLGL
jgi:hypothetical protein